jgi:hypothetical protein
VNNQTVFFPIKQDNNLSNNVNADGNDGLNPIASENQSQFQLILKSLLDNIMSHRSNLSGLNGPDKDLNSLSSIPDGNNPANLLSLLGQKEEPDMLSQGAGQSGSLQLLQSFIEMAGSENNGSHRLVPEIPYTQTISKYKQAMNDFRNAFHLTPAGTPDGLNINTIHQILNGETGVIGNLPGITTPGVNPTKQEVADYITEQCRALGIPAELGMATATTESDLTQFNKDGMPLGGSNSDSTDWGIMQINDKAWGDTYDFNRIKSDWKYNVRAGLQILKNSYDAAARNNEGDKGANSSLENLARAAYSGYNAGTGNIWRYRTSIDDAPKTGPYDVLSNEGYDIRDIRFWNNYQKFI